MKLSIIIPVFQVKATLARCLDSLIAQSFRDWQGILVDDCSTDGSAALCDDYVQRDHRFQVTHLRQNGGLSAARNVGLGKARGEYVTFVDSDDYLAPDTLKTLFEVLATHPDYDLLEYPIYEHYGSKNRNRLQLPRREYTDMTAYWLLGEAYKHAYACNKIFRRELFRNVRFPEGRNFEDIQTLPKVLDACRIVATTDLGLYYYCYNADGITARATGKDLSQLLDAHTWMLRNIGQKMEKDGSGQLDEAMADYYAHVLNIQLDVYRATGRISNYFPTLPYKHTLKLKLMHLLGLKRLCQLHKTFVPSHS